MSFKRHRDIAAPGFTVLIDGREAAASGTDTIASVMLAASRGIAKRSVSGMMRGPFCLMGQCFECLVTVDGWRSEQACMIRATPGMRIETTAGAERDGS
jgi:predicted molibdopterin-dependent oxidoreductase YjgC